MNPEPSNKASVDWFSPGRFALLLGLLIVISFPEILAGTQCFVIKDFGLFSYPLACYHRQSFWRGEFPLWDPLSCCGIPFLAQLNTITLYPLSLIYLLLPMPWSVPFFCLVHQFIAGMGMYFLARRWTGSTSAAALAGLIMAFNGLTLNFLMCPNYIAAFAWMPWVILAAESAWLEGGRKIILASIVAALQILSGGPETILFTWIILGSLALIHFVKQSAPRPAVARRFILVGAIAGALTAAQLLPFLDLLFHSHRHKNYASSEWAMPPSGWGNFLLPIFQGTYWHQLIVQSGQYWTASYYAGIAAMLLAGVALWRERTWRVWLLGFFFLASIVLALGDNGFVYLWLRHVFPAIGFARYPVKFTIITLWTLPLLAASGFRHFENLPAGKKSSSRYVLAAFFTLTILAMFLFARHHSLAEDFFPRVVENGLCRLIFLGAALLAIHFFLKRVAWRKYATLALLALIWLDLLGHMPWQNPGVDPSVYEPTIARRKVNFQPEPALGQSRLLLSLSAQSSFYFQSLPDLKEDYLLHRVIFMANCNLIDKLPKGDGMFALYLHDMNEIINVINTVTCNLDQIEDLMSVSQTTAPGKNFDWIARTNYLPMISAGQKPIFADDAKTLHAITQETVNLHENVFLPQAAQSIITAREKTEARILDKNFQAQKISFTVEAKAQTMIFISQSYYHCWKAYVDGKPTPLWRANAAFQALETPGGHHEVKLIYEDQPFHIGGVISLAALCFCPISFFLLRKKPVVVQFGEKTIRSPKTTPVRQ